MYRCYKRGRGFLASGEINKQRTPLKGNMDLPTEIYFNRSKSSLDHFITGLRTPPNAFCLLKAAVVLLTAMGGSRVPFWKYFTTRKPAKFFASFLVVDYTVQMSNLELMIDLKEAVDFLTISTILLQPGGTFFDTVEQAVLL